MNDESRAPPLSDEDLALRFAREHAGGLRYVSEQGRWYIWDGKRWQRDRKLIGFKHARNICRRAARESNRDAQSRTIASSKTIVAVERLARADHRLAAVIEQFDTDPWLLNTPDGVIDLHNGRMQKHHPDDHMSKMTSVGPDKNCETPIWDKFRKTVTGDDEDYQRYLQRRTTWL